MRGCPPGVATGAAAASKRLSELGDVTSTKVFGAAVIFIDAEMFAPIDSPGAIRLTCDETDEERDLAVGAQRHGRLPFLPVPTHVRVETTRCSPGRSGQLTSR